MASYQIADGKSDFTEGTSLTTALKILKKKKRRLEEVLGKKVVGYRNHYLRFRVPDTWELLSKAGFKYDTTFGYSDCAGFRNGCAILTGLLI